MKAKVLFVFFLAIVLLGCEDDKPKKSIKKPGANTSVSFQKVKRPVFDAELAYQYIQKQVDFGPRIPGSEAQKKTAEYLAAELESMGLEVETQNGRVTTFDGKNWPIFNITGRYLPENPNRIMLFAHWDSRPFADRDDKDQKKAILGANDGASGVGVLLALAKAIVEDSVKPTIGIDIVFFDAEDYGQPSGGMTFQTGETWCLGSQYWARNLPTDFVKPKYGVLLDMVGAQNAVFPKEGGSLKYNRELVEKVWYLGTKLGYGQHFIQDIAYGGITDDHKFVSEMAGIPSIDVIHYDPRKRDFGDFHHRHSDNMEVINKNTLFAVGETMLELVYREK